MWSSPRTGCPERARTGTIPRALVRRTCHGLVRDAFLAVVLLGRDLDMPAGALLADQRLSQLIGPRTTRTAARSWSELGIPSHLITRRTLP